MDGVHDLGGMDGFGPIEHTADEPAFHDEFERRVFATVLIAMAQGHCSMDEFRHAIERMAPERYLDASYYERWLSAIERLLVENGVVSADRLAERNEQFEGGEATVPERVDPSLAETMRSIVESGASPRRGDGDPAFDVGDAVRVSNRHPDGHTRCPGYVRRATGTVQAINGAHVLPDTRAHGEGEQPEPLYTVRFEGTELWGPDAESGTAVSVDLWESYLEAPVDNSGDNA
jgi:nitrile hydratase beta subunit